GGLETLPQGVVGGPTAATGAPPLIHQLLELTGRTVPVSRRRERLSLGDERLLGCGDCGVLLVKMSEVCLACLLERGTRLGEPLPQLPFDVLADASAGSLRFLPLIKQFAHARGVVLPVDLTLRLRSERLSLGDDLFTSGSGLLPCGSTLGADPLGNLLSLGFDDGKASAERSDVADHHGRLNRRLEAGQSVVDVLGAQLSAHQAGVKALDRGRKLDECPRVRRDRLITYSGAHLRA